jgi:hypothetical protein
MKLPDKFTLKETAHGHGDRGMAFYTDEDTAGLGVVRDIRRESSRHPFVPTWRFKWLPDRVFNTSNELIRAVEALTDEDIAAEKAKWPVLTSTTDTSGKDWPNTCWRHRDRKAALQASAATCWIGGQGVIVSLCGECAEGVTAVRVVEIVDERRGHVAASRKAAAQ